MKIKEYLDKEGILEKDMETLEREVISSLPEEDRNRFYQALNNYAGFPYINGNVQEYYNTISEIKVNGVPLFVPLLGIWRNEIEKTSPVVLEYIKNDGLILDVGTSMGYKTRFFALNMEGKIFGLDMNEAVLKVANEKKLDNLQYLRGNLFSMPFEDNLFDSVLYCNSIQEDGIYYFTGYGGFYDYNMNDKIKELVRVVKSNGKLIVGHNGYDDFPKKVRDVVKNNGFNILKNHKFKHKRNDRTFENHVVVGVKK